MLDLQVITNLHRDLVTGWHSRPIDNPCEGVLKVICQQASFNFLLWHEEDIARSPDVSDAKIAEVKSNIDRYNQQRNDWIEQVDDWITADLVEKKITAAADAPQNTETLGSSIDRLCILALRIYHLEEQRDRTDATAEHRESVTRKIAVALVQHEDLSRAAQQLADDIYAGRKKHKTYRQMKMYNDPTMNPYLYKAQRRAG